MAGVRTAHTKGAESQISLRPPGELRATRSLRSRQAGLRHGKRTRWKCSSPSGMISVGQAAQKVDNRFGDLCRTLLLGPMPTAGEHLDVAQEWHVLFHVGDVLGCSRKRDD